MTSAAVAIRASVAIAAMFTIPGAFLLTFGRAWRRWTGLQRWMVAVGLSIAFYPVLFYWARFALPFLTLGPYKMTALLGVLAVTAAWRQRHNWQDWLRLDWLEWVAVAVFGATIFTRFWVVRDLPYPAWSDSLHHALLTQLTAVQGRLPTSLEPYFPIPLAQAHLGLYSLSAVTEWLAGVPAHTALLWTAQTLNGLCGLGIYLVLDRKVGRTGAVVGAVVGGLLSHMPAFYVNWGRFTQLSSQTVLLIAWIVTWEAMASWTRREVQSGNARWWQAILAAMLTGAVFLFHFRVAAFYLPLLLMSFFWELWKSRPAGMQERWKFGALVIGTALVGLLSVLAIAPAAWDAVHVFVTTALQPPRAPAEVIETTLKQYNDFPLSTVPLLVARPWLLALAGASALLGLLGRNKIAIAALLWMVSLYLIGIGYRLGIPLLNITNLGAVMILFYLPIGLLVGSAAQELVRVIPDSWRPMAKRAVIVVALAAGVAGGRVRANEIEPFRFFVTDGDVVAMEWIRSNTPEDALFAVNTYFWMPTMAHGTDGGYWIPYFTGRHITAAAMLMPLAAPDDIDRVVEMSRAAEDLAADNGAMDKVRALGVDYVYIGPRGDFSGQGLNPSQLLQSPQAALVYQSAGVSIFKVLPQ